MSLLQNNFILVLGFRNLLRSSSDCFFIFFILSLQVIQSGVSGEVLEKVISDIIYLLSNLLFSCFAPTRLHSAPPTHHFSMSTYFCLDVFEFSPFSFSLSQRSHMAWWWRKRRRWKPRHQKYSLYRASSASWNGEKGCSFHFFVVASYVYMPTGLRGVSEFLFGGAVFPAPGRGKNYKPGGDGGTKGGGGLEYINFPPVVFRLWGELFSAWNP